MRGAPGLNRIWLPRFNARGPSGQSELPMTIEPTCAASVGRALPDLPALPRSDGALETWPSSTPRKHCDHSISRPPLFALAKCSFLIRLWQNCLDSFGTRGSKLTKAGALRPVRARDGSLLPGAPSSPPLRIAGVRTKVHADFCEMREPASPEGYFACVLGQPIIIVLLHGRVDNVLPFLGSSVYGEDTKAMFAGSQVDRCVKLRRR